MYPHELAGLPIVTYSRMREVHSVEHRLGRPEIADQILLRSEDNYRIPAADVFIRVVAREATRLVSDEQFAPTPRRQASDP